jgi:hypothetical protein
VGGTVQRLERDDGGVLFDGTGALGTAGVAAVSPAGIAYTPTWTATTTNPTLGDGTLTGRYMQVGKWVDFQIRLVFGATTAVGSGAYLFGFPVVMRSVPTQPVCTVVIRQSATSAHKIRWGYMNTTSNCVLRDQDGASVTPSSPYVWASGDSITIAGRYEDA